MMRVAWIPVLIALVAAPLVAQSPALPSLSPQTFHDDLKKKLAAVDQYSPVIPGRDGWMFFRKELEGLAAGKFWNDESGPLPVILDFKAQLQKLGVELIFVPVPAKAAVYPELISDSVGQAAAVPRLDSNHWEFLQLLRAKGVSVLDLLPLFVARKQESPAPLYCKHDTHWSGQACELAAAAIAAEVKRRPWAAKITKRSFQGNTRLVEISGDLWTASAPPKPPREQLPLRFVNEMTPTGPGPAGPWRESPVLLLGDSHNLVFYAGGDMHAVGAGLPDQLAYEIGFPVDVVAVRGSGATPSRVNLMRRGDSLAGKKLVIWCLSVRELTDAQGWKIVPVASRPQS